MGTLNKKKVKVKSRKKSNKLNDNNDNIILGGVISKNNILEFPDRMCNVVKGNVCTKLNKNEESKWLSNFDIENAIQVLLNFHDDSDILYYGNFPMDWSDCHICKNKSHYHKNCHKLARFNINNYIDYSYIIFVFNHDNHDGDGTHWTAAIVNNLKKQINYYDSYGYSVKYGILEFADLILSKQPSYIFNTNLHSHQVDGGECGVFVINFIHNTILHRDFNHFCNESWSTRDMLYIRIILYGDIWKNDYKMITGNKHMTNLLKKSQIRQDYNNLRKQMNLNKI